MAQTVCTKTVELHFCQVIFLLASLIDRQKNKSKSIRLCVNACLAPLLNPSLRLSSVPLQLLMNQSLKEPHDPYVTIDNRFWPPYVEMLLRYDIAVRHQENNFKIRLETFF